MHGTITSVRIDVPLRTAHAYMFVAPGDFAEEPWWNSLYVYLKGLAHPDLEWTWDPVQELFLARPVVSDEQLVGLATFLRTALMRMIANHKTLRNATELSPEAALRLRIVFFSEERK